MGDLSIVISLYFSVLLKLNVKHGKLVSTRWMDVWMDGCMDGWADG